MIVIDATGATNGIDFEAYIRGGFVADVTSGGFPVFDNSAAFSGEEMFIGYGSDAASKYVLAHGSLAYSFATHTVWGTINTIEFGTLGSGSFDSNGYYTGGNVTLRITGLDLSNAMPTNPAEEADIEANGAVHNFAVGYMSKSQAALDKFADALDSQAQHFKGSAYADVYTGTAFDDLIEGNGGDDRLGGGGGNDEVDGGDGVDTAVFAGNQSDYTIVRYSNGVTTVSKDGKTATLRNVEKLDFEDVSDVDVDGLPETAVGRATIDASGSDGIDFASYFADYFARYQVNGTSSYHGGTEDAPYGYLNGDQVSFKYRVSGDTTGPFAGVVILEGEEIAYDSIHYPGQGYAHGNISGSIDKLIFGTIDGAAPTSGPDLYTAYKAELVISGLGIHNDPGSGGSGSEEPVPMLYYGVRGGIVASIDTILSRYAFDFIGSDGADAFAGGIFDDGIDGGLGDDDLSGGQGQDAIRGGGGNDKLAGGSGEDKLYGGDGHDDLKGDEGNDLLRGEIGDDTLAGGSGDDDLLGDAGDDKLQGDAGRDRLYGGDGKDDLDGGDDNDELSGGAGNDKAAGGDGDDLIAGGLGNDQLHGGAGGDLLRGGHGKDIVEGGAGQDVLYGNQDKDVLRGGESDDVLIGGRGKDQLYGGEGADTFVFLGRGHSGVTQSVRDVIRDFSRGDGDKIDLSALKGALAFIGTARFSGDEGEVRYSDRKKAATMVLVDVNGDRDVDMKIKLDGKIALGEGDFIL